MSDVTNVKIIVEKRFELDYESPEDLKIVFNRTVDDLTNLDKRFGEFSYTFSLPQTKINTTAFEYANTKGRRGIFVGTQKSCRVYNNNKLLLDGIIELRAVSQSTYDCAFFSKFTQLLDTIGDKKLQEITSSKVGVWNEFEYETSIIEHLNRNDLSVDDAEYPVQFPQVYYSTPWTPYSVLFDIAADFEGNPFIIPDNFQQNYYYLFGQDNNAVQNKWFFHQFPMAVYIIPVLEGLLEDAGWTLGGSFFEREEIKRIIMLYTGDNDVYDRAAGCSEETLDQCTGTTSPTVENLLLTSFLPDLSQTEFIKGLMNTFNLYFTLDIDNRIIKFETWNTLFSDKYNPYDITNKVRKETVTFSRIDNFDPTIKFQSNDNQRVLGDNKVMVNDAANASDVNYQPSDSGYTNSVFNRIGTTSEITVPFGLPQIGRHYLRQDFDIAGSDKVAGDFEIFIPNLTAQTPEDNDSKPFYKTTGDTFVQNDESTIKHKGKPTLMYYYGQSDSDLEQVTGNDNDRFYYVGIGSTPTRTKFGVSSPFTLVQGNALDRVNDYLASSPNPKSIGTAETSYLKGLHFMMGKTGSTVSNVPEYSLTFGEDNTYHETLWTKFHKPKYDLYLSSEVLDAEMRFNDVDWQELQINRPVMYNDEIYSIISIENYDVVNRSAKIKLIKK